MQINIVFVDDNIDICEMYEDLFNSSSLHVKSFTNTQTAKTYIENNKIDICFIDYRMPNLDGVSFRKLIPKEIPCIMLTGELLTSPKEGFIDILNKPVIEEEFFKLIQMYCRK